MSTLPFGSRLFHKPIFTFFSLINSILKHSVLTAQKDSYRGIMQELLLIVSEMIHFRNGKQFHKQVLLNTIEHVVSL